MGINYYRMVLDKDYEASYELCDRLYDLDFINKLYDDDPRFINFRDYDRSLSNRYKVDFFKHDVIVRLDYIEIVVFFRGSAIYETYAISDSILVKLQYLASLKSEKAIKRLIEEIKNPNQFV
jgi:hypothetical protein